MKRWSLMTAGLFALAVPCAGQGTGSVEGVVFDSTTMAPLAEARVAVLGTNALVRADEEGRFALEVVPAGEHRVTFFHPRLQELGISASPALVTVTADDRSSVRLAVPSQATLLRAWCLSEVPGGGFTPVAGFVRDSITGVALPRAAVHLHVMDRDGRTLRTVTGRTEESGYYRICDVPPGANARIEADFGVNTSLPMRVQVPEAGAVFQDLQLTLSAVGEIQGKVTDYDTKRPLSGALVRVLGTEARQVTDEDGEFVLTEVPPGLHTLETEYLGYATRTDSVTIFSEEAILVDIPLAQEAIAIRGMTVTARGRVGEPLVSIGTRQDFLGRAEVEAILPRARTMGDLISAAAFPGLSIRNVQIDTGAGLYPGICVEHNRVRRGGMGCRMISVFVDGVRLPDPSTYLMELDPNNVETIQLISPSDAQMVYGQDGVNGVVVITTRRGRE